MRSSLPNVAMIRDYGWRVGGSAAGVTAAGVGSGDWLGIFLLCASNLISSFSSTTDRTLFRCSLTISRTPNITTVTIVAAPTEYKATIEKNARGILSL